MTSHKVDKAAFTPSQLTSSHPTLSILGSRIAFQSPIKTNHFESSRDGANRRKKKKKKATPQWYWVINHNQPEFKTFNGNIGHNQDGPRHLQKQRQHQHKGCVQLAKRPQRYCWENVKIVPQHTRIHSANEVSLLHCSDNLHWSFWVQQASAHTCLNLSVPSYSTWQGLKTSDLLTLLSVDYGPEILRGEDTDGLAEGTGIEFSGNSAVPGNSSDIYGIIQF